MTNPQGTTASLHKKITNYESTKVRGHGTMNRVAGIRNS
jgi:hypothetical protein